MPYRDDEHALQAKKEQLEQDRARIEEHKRTLVHLADDEARVDRELADIEQRIAKRKKSLPLLAGVRVASPCNADWNGMHGDDQSRFCDKCAKNVYNLSAMTTEQAEALIREKEGDLCARYYQRTDGTVLTADCPVGVRKKRVKAAAFVAAVGAAASVGLYAWAASTVQGKMGMTETRMGKLEAFDDDHIEEQIEMMSATMGMMALPEVEGESEAESQDDEVVQKVDQGRSKAKPIQPKIAPKKPIVQKITPPR
jgi:hypothetical protein